MMSISWNNNPEVFPDSDMVVDMSVVEVGQPVLANKLPVSQQTFNAVSAKQFDELFQECDSLLGRRVASLGHHLIQYRKDHPLINYGQYQDIDIGGSEFPVGSVHGQTIRWLVR